MIICICKNISESQIKKAIQTGSNTLEALQADLDVCNRCQICEYAVLNIIEECNDENHTKSLKV